MNNKKNKLGRAVPSSEQIWFVKVLPDLWVFILIFQPMQTPEPILIISMPEYKLYTNKYDQVVDVAKPSEKHGGEYLE